jgi:hypothetical protein
VILAVFDHFVFDKDAPIDEQKLLHGKECLETNFIS